MTETMLLIGGPADGRRVKIDGRPRVWFVPRANRLDFSLDVPPEREAMVKDFADKYERVERCVYVHESVSRLDIINLLVSGYRNEIGV